MRYGNKIAPVFFVLSLVFGLVSMPLGAALSQGSMDRATYAKVVDDENAALELKGFNNETYSMNGSYKSVGSITNNTNQLIILTVTIIPDLKGADKTSTKFGVKIGNERSEFRYLDSPKNVTLTLSPGEVVDVEASLTPNLFSPVSIEFIFKAVDNSGDFTLELGNTLKTTRRINCY